MVGIFVSSLMRKSDTLFVHLSAVCLLPIADFAIALVDLAKDNHQQAQPRARLVRGPDAVLAEVRLEPLRDQATEVAALAA